MSDAMSNMTTAVGHSVRRYDDNRHFVGPTKGPIGFIPHSPDETAISGTFGTVFDYYSASYR